MNQVLRPTYILILLSLAYVLLYYFTIHSPANTLAYALGRGLLIWIVAGVVVGIQWSYCTLFKKKGEYLKQLNWMAIVMIVVSLILWVRAL